MKAFKNLKYTVFIFILVLTGIVYYERQDIRDVIGGFLHPETENPGGNPGMVSGGDGSGSASEGNTAVSRGDATGGNASISGGDSVSGGDSISGGDGVLTGSVSGGDGTVHWRYQTVDESYFDDAVFIGDSRTVGLYDYAGLSNTTFYASTGLTVYKVFSAPIVSVPGQKNKITVEEALSGHQFKKIYFMIGINEMGTGTVDTFMEKYKEVVAHLQELQPDAIIYLQAIMRVSTERSNKGDYINNPGIDARNAEIAKLADNKKIFYLDVNPLVCDDTGGLIKEDTFDGVHLKAAYIDIWKQFLMDHAIEFY